MAGIITMAKAEAIKFGFSKVFNFTPKIVYTDDYAEIILDNNQQGIVRSWIENQMNKKPVTKSDIKIDVLPIIIPIAAKKAFPFVIGTAITGFLLGGKK